MLFRATIFSMLVILFSTSSTLKAAQYFTSAHPVQSSLTLEFFFGDPTVDPEAVKLATVGPGELTGTVTANTILDGAGDGSLEFVGANLVLEDLVGTIDIELIGSVEYQVLGLGIDFVNPPEAVSGNAFQFPYSNQTMLTVNQGDFVLDNPTGIIELLLGPFVPFEIDFSVTPFAANPNFVFGLPFEGTVDAGPGLLTPLPEINFEIPAVTTPLLLGIEPDVFLQFSGEVHIAVPEPKSWSMFAVGAPILLAAVVIKRRRPVGSVSGPGRPPQPVT